MRLISVVIAILHSNIIAAATATATATLRRLEDESCTLLLKVSDNNLKEIVCDFKTHVAKLIAPNGTTSVQEKLLDWIETGRIVSGVSTLSASNIDLSSDKLSLALPNSDDWERYIIPEGSESSNGKDRKRLQRSTTGTRSVLVLRVITGSGSQVPPSDETRLSDKWYGTSGDLINNKSQFAACSFGQLTFEPFIGTTITGVNIASGVYTITVDADRDDSDVVEAQARQQGNLELGDMETQFDHVAFSIPNNNEDYSAYSYVNNWLSVMKDDYIDQVTVQMFCIGRNIGLSNSGDSEDVQGDLSGVMGAQFYDDRRICFNGAKSADLGWYSDRLVDATNGYNGLLYGITDYGVTNAAAKMILQLPQRLPNRYKDIYISFNKGTGINAETGEGINQVLVHQRATGGYSDSFRLSSLSAGDSYTPEGDGDQRIFVNSIDSVAADVVIGTPPPSQPPVSCIGQFITIDLTTDLYSYETSFQVTNSGGSVVMYEDVFDYWEDYQFIECLLPDSYYFTIMDGYGDGICCFYSPSGSYSVKIDDVTIREGGEFGYSESTFFTVVSSTASPTATPTSSPVSMPCYDALLDAAVGQNTANCNNIPASACSNPIAQSHCPVLCGVCSEFGCADSFMFLTTGSNSFTCTQLQFLGESDRESYCRNEYLYSTCRATCKICE